MPRSTLLINVDVGETRVALIEDGILAEMYLERSSERSPVGNVYLGRVTRVLPGMQAAFIDIGLDRAAFLHVEDVIPSKNLDKILEERSSHDDDEGGEQNNRLSRKTPIAQVLTEGQPLMVQVSKAPIGTKGARVTSHIAFPGRYVMYLPTVQTVGVSKRIGNERERRRLKEVIDSVKPPTGGVIVRTVGQGLTKKKLKTDIGYLVKIWEETAEKKDEKKKPPFTLYEELDISLRAVRDLFTEEVDEIVVDDKNEYERINAFLEIFLPERVKDVSYYNEHEPLFDEYGIEEEIARALSRRVPLPSGGHLVIDQAEALTAIDVNTGRFTGKGKNLSQTIFQTNLEAVKEIAYQLRFRNIGGIIVIDFIDMDRSNHRDKVYKELVKVLKTDKAKTTVVRISELGLVEMTRKRTRESLGRTLFEPCFYCDGTGFIRSKKTICHEILRQLRREKDNLAGYSIVISAHPAICDVLEREEKGALQEAESYFQRRIVLEPHSSYHIEQYNLRSS